LESRVEELAPKADFYDQVTASDDWKPLYQFGKVSGIGARKIFEFLHEIDFIYYNSGRSVPTAPVETQKLLCLKEHESKDYYGRKRVNYKIYVSGKGEQTILYHWNKRNGLKLLAR
jgi:phage antirepressor YoqD-like protein